MTKKAKLALEELNKTAASKKYLVLNGDDNMGDTMEEDDEGEEEGEEDDDDDEME